VSGPGISKSMLALVRPTRKRSERNANTSGFMRRLTSRTGDRDDYKEKRTMERRQPEVRAETEIAHEVCSGSPPHRLRIRALALGLEGREQIEAGERHDGSCGFPVKPRNPRGVFAHLAGELPSVSVNKGRHRVVLRNSAE
jgi:hypothetical protein